MAQCYFPYHVEQEVYFSQEDRYIPVPCGKCPECLKRRTQSWIYRLEKEAQLHKVQHFITLTYAKPPISENGFMTLRHKDVQDFFKRLRKRTKSKIRYYMCGEYGTQGKRPHYHIILFSDENTTEQSIIKSWQCNDSNGHVHFGSVTNASIGYTVQYYDKGDWYPEHARDDRVPEYSVMSKGLGRLQLTPQFIRYIEEQPDRPFLTIAGGRKMAIPEYYIRRIFKYNGTEALVRQHPSWLVHRDEQLLKYEKRKQIIKKIQDEKDNPENTRELHEARGQAIRAYRKSKRKLRNTL